MDKEINLNDINAQSASGRSINFDQLYDVTDGRGNYSMENVQMIPPDCLNENILESNNGSMVLEMKKEIENLRKEMKMIKLSHENSDIGSHVNSLLYDSNQNANENTATYEVENAQFIDYKNEKCAVFCIDTSHSSNSYLKLMKSSVETTLEFRKNLNKENYFGIICFDTDVRSFSDDLKKCDEYSIFEAASWLSDAKASKGTNALGALIKALQYKDCDAIHLLTDGFPDQSPSEILNVLSVIEKKCKIHCYYLYSKITNPKTVNFLTQLSVQTEGSLKLINCNQNTYIAEVVPVYSAYSGLSQESETSKYSEFEPQKYLPVTNFLMPQNCKYDEKEKIYNDSYSIKSNNIPGKLVLARFLTDGLFYLCTVIDQINTDSFVIKFPGSTPVKENSFCREVKSNDLMIYEDSLNHSLDVGCKVLAPVNEDPMKFAPATIIDGKECRLPEGKYDDTLLLTVLFFTGKKLKVKANKAVWISSSFYEKLVFEIQLPVDVRKYFINSRYSHSTDIMKECHDSNRDSVISFEPEKPLESSSYIMPYMNSCTLDSKLFENDKTKPIPGTDLCTDELNQKVMSLIMEYKGNKQPSLNSALVTSSKKTDSLSKLRKSVSFQDLDSGIGGSSNLDESLLDSEYYDSGVDSDNLALSDSEFDYYKDFHEDMLRNEKNVNGSPLLSRRKRKSSNSNKPKWNYWKNKPIPNLLESNHYGPYRYGPYESSMTTPVFEAYPAKDEWTSPLSRYVDVEAVSKHSSSVQDCMHMQNKLNRPKTKPNKGVEFSYAIRENHMKRNKMEEVALESKKSMVMQRMTNFVNEREKEFHKAQETREYKQKRQIEKINLKYGKENDIFVKAQRLQDSKSKMHNELLKSFDVRSQCVADRENFHLKSRIQAAEQRSMSRNDMMQEKEQSNFSRQANKEERILVRINNVHQQRENSSAVENNQEQIKRNAKIQRIEKFHKMEENSLKQKHYNTVVFDQNKAIFSSTIFP